MKFVQAPNSNTSENNRTTTGALKAGEVFVGEVFQEHTRLPGKGVTGTFIVANRSGVQFCVNLFTGHSYNDWPFVTVDLNIKPNLRLE